MKFWSKVGIWVAGIVIVGLTLARDVQWHKPFDIVVDVFLVLYVLYAVGRAIFSRIG